jgi:ubiquinone/menaquinone biosynthesis C-methylase UbiE
MVEPDNSHYQKVVNANEKLHTVLASSYNETEPHFRAENIAHVDKRLSEICSRTAARRLLDLGCGTGFIINIAKKYVQEIDGVDITEAMLRRVDRSGDAIVRLHLADTGSCFVKEGSYDVVTAYSFLHHLYDIEPTLRNAAKALRRDGEFYADLEPNFYFWKAIKELNSYDPYDPIVKREINAVIEKDADIQAQFRIDRDTFNHAEYGKSILGGFAHEKLAEQLLHAGFRDIKIFYYWFLGQSELVNDSRRTRAEQVALADVLSEILIRGLPLTRKLFKYIGFVATR